MRFKDKVVLVTGSSSGIGAVTALSFAKEGADVVVNYLSNYDGAIKLSEQIKALGRKCLVVQADVSKELESEKLISRAIEYFGKLDILVNNAGKYEYNRGTWEDSSDILREIIDINLLSTLNCSKFACKFFLKQKKGVIVNVSSRQGIIGKANAIAYGASKAGVINLTKAYAKEMAPYVRVNCVSPGPVKAGYWLTEDAQSIIEDEKKKLLFPDLIEPEDIANAILFLSSDESRMITGHNLVVDAGYLLK
ncbi:MAG: beta-ketoacyl-ACP reductase [Candidatus Dojkabacteria bacterium]|nr:MAG: beta-ketoacyl-ACP reductase [Candidatus Dojkabacteria bacterium]